MLGKEAYHTIFLSYILTENRHISHLEALNAVVAITTWAEHLWGRLVHLYCDNAMAVVVFQAGHGMDTFVQSCANQLWRVCARYDISHGVSHIHIPVESLLASADALSRWHLGQPYITIEFSTSLTIKELS